MFKLNYQTLFLYMFKSVPVKTDIINGTKKIHLDNMYLNKQREIYYLLYTMDRFLTKYNNNNSNNKS